MPKIRVELYNEEQWYNVIREANTWFGHNNWRGQSNIRRKLRHREQMFGPTSQYQNPVYAWFEVPDLQFGTWLGVKYTINAEIIPAK